MRKHIRSVWARSNEHIRVQRGRHPVKQKPAKALPIKINGIYIIVAGCVCWVVLSVAAAVLESVFAFLVTALPWLALGGVCGVVIRIIFGKPGVLKKR